MVAARAVARARVLLLLGFAAAPLARTAGAEEAGGEPAGAERKSVGYSLPAGATHDGDLYLFRPTVRIAGEQRGDLVAAAQSVSVVGEVDGDVFAFAQTVEITGKAGDSVRAFAETVNVSGTIERDLLAFAKTVSLMPGSKVTGDVVVFGQNATVGGHVGGSLRFGGGQISISGIVDGDARVRCEQIEVDPSARIGGDLSYTARNRLDLEGKGIVGGQVDYEEKKAREKERKPFFTVGKAAKFLALFLSSFLVGVVALNTLRGPASRAVDSLAQAPLFSAATGFVALLVTPVAAVILSILLLTIPVAVLLFLLWLVGLYVGKLPVAVWLGRWLLGGAGRRAPPAPLSLLVGLLVLYALFWIPCAGSLLWFAATFLGLGAILVGARERAAEAAPPATS